MTALGIDMSSRDADLFYWPKHSFHGKPLELLEVLQAQIVADPLAHIFALVAGHHRQHAADHGGGDDQQRRAPQRALRLAGVGGAGLQQRPGLVHPLAEQPRQGARGTPRQPLFRPAHRRRAHAARPELKGAASGPSAGGLERPGQLIGASGGSCAQGRQLSGAESGRRSRQVW